MKIAAARADDAGALWYPIEAMSRPGVPVIVALNSRNRDGELEAGAGGYEIIAEIRRHQRRRLPWWYQLGAWGGESYGWIRSETIELEMVGRDPPTPFSPVAFRPMDLNAWRYPLPEPLASAFGRKRPPERTPEPAEGIDPHQGSDDWPYPGLRLGQQTPPATRQECEARLLRAFRTAARARGVGHAVSDYCADIPRENAKIALAYGNAERVREERRQGIAQPLEALRSGWTPSRRDLADWDYALDWLCFVDGRCADVVEMRAADPPFSFRQIASRLRITRPTAEAAYARAIDVAFASAKFNGGARAQ